MHMTESDLASHVNPGPGGDSHAVTFMSGITAWRRASNSFSLHGAGTIEFGHGPAADTLTIAGTRHRTLRSGVPERHNIRLADICDAYLSGTTLHFTVRAADGAPARQVGFAVPDPRAGRAILQALPQRYTEAFLQEQVERLDFHGRLKQLGSGAPVTLALVAVNLIVFVLMGFDGAGLLSASDGDAAIRWGSNFGPLTVDGQWWRLFTSMFIHSGLLHVGLNMLALYQSGRMVERMYGSVHFALLYLFSGLSGSMVSILWHPMNNSVGASGAIFGVFGGLLAFILKPGSAVPPAIVNEHRNSTLFFIGFNLINGYTQTGIDNGAHLGGLLGGLAFGFLLARPLDLAQRARAGAARMVAPVPGCLLLLALLAYPLWHPGLDIVQQRSFRAVLHALPQQEQLASADASAWLGKARKHTISDAELADAMEQKVVPQWERLYRSVQDATLNPKAADYPLRQTLLRYLDDRRRASLLIAQGVRRHDTRLIEQSNQLTLDAQREIATIQKLSAK
ncbi:rhomboid family intramembrane serine protease [Rugamonas sp.]|uniref:rhomboid family intramembrane serine protease n=1 Tax=Rugamonas sp. TaxID=1926287 RepID=UPI0025CBB4B0|nr:rhomboid family intramembrane serine protease [Rugamonas sp.]